MMPFKAIQRGFKLSHHSYLAAGGQTGYKPFQNRETGGRGGFEKRGCGPARRQKGGVYISGKSTAALAKQSIDYDK